MKIAYFDCFSGASGDMILAAALDAGLDLAALHEALAGLKVGGYRLEAAPIRKQGFAATQFTVHLDPTADKPHRHLHHIEAILDAADLPAGVRDRARRIFARLAQAEAAAHGTTIEKVHFHEVGAIDAIVDIVGACVALDKLGIEKVYVSPIPPGSGTVTCDHGVMPVPAPATAALLQGVPLAECAEIGELITPTGAAILTTLAEDFGPLPAMTIERIGIGAGRREGQTRPNILRLLVGEAVETGGPHDADEILVIEANLDDISSQVVAHVCQRLFDAGARDVFTTAIYMKKNRPAVQVTVLAEPGLRDTMEEILFRETTTFGIRSHRACRSKLRRTYETVDTPAGPVRIKLGWRGRQRVQATPEYDDCRALAEQTNRPIREILEEAQRLWREQSR